MTNFAFIKNVKLMKINLNFKEGDDSDLFSFKAFLINFIVIGGQ